ncbi:PiT family inorganic phosphate transporter [Methanomicrobium sp. W14]|uniref:inorganic phosphate transporter n=1 Tax=Methanomicrobium sp. W14 TaxID=2817839 RepID=UPI001AE36090|nr:inorganic phosphate transporter [Methanomicrobium sp. W14]MBP2132173.1 PiT family inorganic phosphate transporter [Methanomicrobium sp. W14]
MDIIVIVLGIFLALMFNFVNGLNDAANSIATVVATKALTPFKAVLMASVFNMLGPFLFSTAIAKTIGKGIVESSFLTTHLILAAMVGAVIWVFFASYFGIPVSSSHALVGGLVGAGIVMGGMSVIIWPDLTTVLMLLIYAVAGGLIVSAVFAVACVRNNDDWKRYLGFSFLTGIALTVPLLMITGTLSVTGIFAVIIFIVVSPMLGMISAFLLGVVIMRIFRNKSPHKIERGFRPFQVVAGAFQAIGHGANDAQNAMGMITAMLFAAGVISAFEVPLWVIVSSCLAISLGTLLGGWKVIDKMANKITKIRPYQGLSASFSGSGVLALMTSFGVPVSTTHAISGSIMGAGMTRGYTSAVRWNSVREIIAAWFLTIPCAAIVSGIVYFIYASVML